LSNRREMYHMGIKICKNVCTLCLLYRPDQGNIVGREYIHSCKFLYPYGTSLGDSTIITFENTVFSLISKENATISVASVLK
jgi:hypothetical protein